jgi:hypothetical protein
MDTLVFSPFVMNLLLFLLQNEFLGYFNFRKNPREEADYFQLVDLLFIVLPTILVVELLGGVSQTLDKCVTH